MATIRILSRIIFWDYQQLKVLKRLIINHYGLKSFIGENWKDLQCTYGVEGKQGKTSLKQPYDKNSRGKAEVTPFNRCLFIFNK